MADEQTHLTLSKQQNVTVSRQQKQENGCALLTGLKQRISNTTKLNLKRWCHLRPCTSTVATNWQYFIWTCRCCLPPRLLLPCSASGFGSEHLEIPAMLLCRGSQPPFPLEPTTWAQQAAFSRLSAPSALPDIYCIFPLPALWQTDGSKATDTSHESLLLLCWYYKPSQLTFRKDQTHPGISFHLSKMPHWPRAAHKGHTVFKVSPQRALSEIKPARQKQLATLPILLFGLLPEKPSFLFCQHWYSEHIIHILLEGISLALQGPTLTWRQMKVTHKHQCSPLQPCSSTLAPSATSAQLPLQADPGVPGVAPSTHSQLAK